MSRSAGRIGWFLVWAVVFCDIGTSVYYVPGILYAWDGERAGIFVLATMIAFLLLSVKVVESARRFPSGGGVVSLADRAFGPWWGCLGGQLIMVDYFLTVAISAAAGVYYLATVVPPLGALVVPVTVLGIALLATLNVIGIKESARVSTVLAGSALLVNLGVVVATLISAPPEALARIPQELAMVREVTPGAALVGYAGAWLAFSGLESLTQLAPAMRDLGKTPRYGMIAVVVTVLATSPILTFLALSTLPDDVKAASPESFVAQLAGLWGGAGLKLMVVATATALLFFAANTAIAGNYHVQLALTRRRFLPETLSSLHDRFQTPWLAILLSTGVPIVVVLASSGNLVRLGELYAFGLLGAFSLSSVGLDVLRWRDGDRGLRFWVGVLTSVAVVVAFATNLWAKPLATLFGGGATVVGMALALGTRSGFFVRVQSRIPRLAPPRTIEAVTETPFHTVEQAVALPRHALPGILVASRGASRKLYAEAVDRAKARGQDRLFVIYVDEVPGLFYPQLASPTQEGLTVLEAGGEIVRSMGLRPVPIWGLSHSAAATVGDVAEALGCDTVVIGATQRTFLWQALRGKFIQDLLAHLPGTIRLVVVG